ncbi:MAG: phenylalanine--tRNA ligase subunit alpha [Elusimicrobia bacterium RIFOXYA2_FULL_39_19]|nr:MAG: phenylalanine--tRNA ligase subunit alpha [Elusimicrobia bacterium RIFOXYA2_FULL_39_19]
MKTPHKDTDSSSIQSKIENISKELNKELGNTSNSEAISNLKNKYLGRKGSIQSVLKLLPDIEIDDRKKYGKVLNELKTNAENLFENKQKEINKNSKNNSKKNNADLSLPGYPVKFANSHPLTQIKDKIISIFESLGFQIALGPEIETDYYNFEALNIPKDHPARDLQDTFYIKNEFNTYGNNLKVLLRTHTSPVQVRIMEKVKPPIRIIVPGRVYRNEAVDSTHSAVFHQIEGLAVDANVTFADLKATLECFAKRFFGETISVRFRPSYFPFTEPSAEMDIGCVFCSGKGCSICKKSGWLEALGCGMVNPRVFDYVKFDREKYTGFAFGIGIERLAMLKFKVNDMRLFYENDLRFLRQF